MHYRELSTPALTIDLDILERNLDRMARYCRERHLGLRPHTKTHKTLEVARLQLDRGAVGLTVAKVGEAEVMASAGATEPPEILVAYPIYGGEKLRRLSELALARRILLSLDSEVTAQELSRAAVAQGAVFGVLVEFDSGLRRCGVEPGPACVELAKKVEALPGLKFRGLMTYYGNIWGTEAERRDETIRPGTYAYNDLNTFYQGACGLEDCAARVVATVVSTAVPGRAMIDAGSKTLSSDALGSGPKTGHGYVVEAPDAKLIKLNEEHGHLDITGSARQFRVGEVVTVIPNHVCTCVNMHDEVFLLRNEEVVGCWRVAARGKIR